MKGDDREAAVPEGKPIGLSMLRWLPGYGAHGAKADVAAGLTVAVLLIPQSMAYALLAGVPPVYGLYASLIPLLMYPFFGTSMHLAVGVIAIDMLFVHAGLEGLAEPFSPRYVELAILLALMVGLVQLLMGVTRMGFLVNLLSRPVMVGFTSGAALIIALSQVEGLAGVDMEGARILPTQLWALSRHVGDVEWVSLGLGLAALAVVLAMRRWVPRVPGALVAMVLGTLAVWAFGLHDGATAVVGEVPRGLPAFAVPRMLPADVRSLLPTAFGLALVQFLTVISLGKVFGARNRYSVGPNRELVSLGMANIAGSFFRSVPVSGSFSRTALNEQAGARTPAANWVAAATVGLALVVLTPVLSYVPIPVLSAIIVVAALGLLDLEEMRFLRRAKTADGWITVLTFVATVGAGILEGILTGVVASVLMLLYRISRPNTAVLGHLPGTRSFRDLRHSEKARALEGILVLRVDASFSFMNAEYLRDLILRRTARDRTVRAIVVDASSVNDLDTTATEVLGAVKRILDRRGIDLYFGGVKEPVQDVLRRSGLYDEMGPGAFFLSPHRAVTHILTGWGVSGDYLRNVPGAIESAELGVPEP